MAFCFPYSDAYTHLPGASTSIAPKPNYQTHESISSHFKGELQRISSLLVLKPILSKLLADYFVPIVEENDRFLYYKKWTISLQKLKSLLRPEIHCFGMHWNNSINISIINRKLTFAGFNMLNQK